MGFIRFFVFILVLLSMTLFGFCAFSLRVIDVHHLSDKPNDVAKIVKSDNFIKTSRTINLNRAFYPSTDQQHVEYNNAPSHFNIRMEKINNLRMQPRCVDK